MALRYAGHSRAARRLRREIIDTAGVASALGLAGTDQVDGYVAAEELGAIVARHALVESAEGPYTFRATSMDLDIVRSPAGADVVLAALDLAESLDVRERQAGLNALDTSTSPAV